LRINRYLAAAVALVAILAVLIDGYAYVFKLYHHLPLKRPLTSAPTLFHRPVYIAKGLDLQGGTEIVLEIDPRTLAPGTKLADAQASTASVMEKRVNGIGVNEATVQAQGDRRVVVQLPGVDYTRAVALIGRTARLTLNTWVQATPKNGKLQVPVDVTGTPVVDPRQVPVSEGGKCAVSTPLLECIPPNALPKFIGIDGNMITTASTGLDQTSNQPTVDFTLNEQGANILAQVTANMSTQPFPQDQLAIFLDNQMVNTAHVQQALSAGQVQISGGTIQTDPQVRNDLATTLSAGRLPGKISVVEANSVGATLGFDSVRRALLAGVLGLAVVVVFMIAYYRLPGLVASLALVFYAAVTLAIFKLIPVTLTLAGLAGFVLSVGMAVDANVLIFERLREELRNGRSLAAAAEAAHNRAFPAIRDSNISTLITCAVLFLHDRLLPFLPSFTLAKGFALTLGIGVAVSFVSAVIVTQLILQVAIGFKGMRRPALYAVERMQ
jgi:preprotein translocase subunit SecD